MKKILLILCVIAFSCQSGKQDEIAELKEVVMALHDDVMPKMSELNYTRKELMAFSDSLQASDSTQAAVYATAAKNIADANNGMRNWMQNYEPDFQGTDEEYLEYLNGQKEAIQKVKDDMEGSLADGKALLEEY